MGVSADYKLESQPKYFAEIFYSFISISIFISFTLKL